MWDCWGESFVGFKGLKCGGNFQSSLPPMVLFLRRVMDLRRGRGKGRVFGERKFDSISGSSSRTDNNEEVLVDNYVNVREGVKGLKLDQSGAAKETEFVEKYSRNLQFPINNWISGNDLDMNMSRLSSVNSSVGDISTQSNYIAGSLRSRESMDQWVVERDRFEGYYASPRVVAERGRVPISAYPDEGPSNYELDSFQGHGEQKYRGDLSEVENLEQDRAELLRKLDELKEKLSRTYDVADKPREMVPIERSRTPPDPYGDRLTYNLSMQPYAVDKPMPRPPHFNYSHGPHGYAELLSSSRASLNVIPEYEDPSQLQMKRRPPHHPPQYPTPPPHEYFMAQQHMDFNLHPLASCHHENVFHSPRCSCLSCYNQNSALPPQVPLADFGNKGVPNVPSSLNSYHHVNPATLRPHNYNLRNASPPPFHTRWQSDLASDNDGGRHPRRPTAVNRHGRIFHPVAGGAQSSHALSKLRCGSCSTVISLEIKNKKLITSAPKESNQLSPEIDPSSNEVLKGSVLSSHSSQNASDTNFRCDDLDNSGNNLQSIDTKDSPLADDQRLNLDTSEKMKCLSSSSSILSKEEEEISDSVIARRNVPDSAELPTKDSFSPARPGSPLWEQSDDSPSKHAVSIDGKGNKSECIDQDKVLFSMITSGQNSVKDRSVETEVDSSFNEYLNTSISQDSAEGSKDEDRPKIGRGTDSFLVGLIKTSFKDFTKSNEAVERTRPSVFINGQPLADHVVKKAEKRAGPIRPGDYWYDFRAGFWGVMGQTCLGIIPPFIEEFYYPMPTNCAAGNTGVHVNGRELHQRDLDLLASRGLPTTKNKFYIIEISGKVTDEGSGQELGSLGKLAPTHACSYILSHVEPDWPSKIARFC
ncbi:Protein of unknown function D [Prunus dulcis]|uniref:Uncharacterized protein n=1 Tax=Prunus dulcis TaxID=3755 RepID=A0A4Y1RGL1_PRUDU|nr:Protein of unknown function D [Prunus dulcis]